MITSSTTTIPATEEQAFTVFSSAVLRYLDSVDDAVGQQFEAWLDEHAEDEEMLPHLLQTYPKFGDIFADEIEKSGSASTPARS